MMAKRVSASNAVVQAVEHTCAFYGVPVFRMQSRVFQVVGAGGRERPMVVGGWRDEYGTKYTKGMPDLLATPRMITHSLRVEGGMYDCISAMPLWIECKSGSGELRPEQRAFKQYVESKGAHHIVCYDSSEALLDWFKQHGVRR